MSTLYINRAADAHHTHYPPAIIKADPHPDRRHSLIVLAPVSIARRWPTMSVAYWQPVADDGAGARELTLDEWRDITGYTEAEATR